MPHLALDRPDGSMPVYSALPPGGVEPRLPLVLLHEAFGLNGHIESIADRLAAAGHPVVAPHLHYRLSQTAVGYDEVPRAVELLQALTVDDMVGDVEAAAVVLPGAESGFGVIGYCFGAAVAYVAAARVAGVRAAVAFYPVSIGNYWDEAGPPRVPLLTLFGADDEFLGARELEWLAGLDADPYLPMTVHIYPGTGHAFFNDARPDLYRAVTAGDAWARTLEFFAES